MSKQFKGLGKGLDAIFQSNTPTNDFQTPKSNDKTVNEIELTRIKPNPEQPRTEFDPEAINELAQSIKRIKVTLLLLAAKEGSERPKLPDYPQYLSILEKWETKNFSKWHL